MIRTPKHASELEPQHLVPFCPYGAGQWTAHPIGLFFVLGFMAMGLAAMPETRWLLLASAAGAQSSESFSGFVIANDLALYRSSQSIRLPTPATISSS